MLNCDKYIINILKNSIFFAFVFDYQDKTLKIKKKHCKGKNQILK